MDEKRNFKSDDHALMTGVIVGMLIQAGFGAFTMTDDAGDYLPAISLRLDYGDPEPRTVQLWVVGQ